MKNSFSRGDKWLFGASLFVLAALLGGTAWYRYVNEVPVINIPPYPPLPNPNGYDLYIQAAGSFSDSNPAVDEIIDTHPTTDPKIQAQRYSLARREAWLQKNAQGFQLFQKALKTPSLHPSQRFAVPPGITGGRSIREMARYKAIEARTWEIKGQWDKGIQSRLDTLQMGNDVARGGPIIPALVGIAVQAIGRNGWWNDVEHLNSVQSLSAAARMESIYAKRNRADATFQEEKYCGQVMLMGVFQRSGWRLFWVPKNKVFNNYNKALDLHIANARRSYLQIQPVPSASDPLTNILLPTFGRVHWNFARGDAGNALLLVSLALRAYKLEQGKYPAQLKELTPKYLKQIPADPFGGGESLRYKNQGNSYLLYSIGPDGVDNGGKPVPHRKNASAKQKQQLAMILEDSKGDYVAGKNR